VYPSPDRFSETWRLDRSFRPLMSEDARSRRYQGWRDAIARAVLVP
jgi:glycerol kinase